MDSMTTIAIMPKQRFTETTIERYRGMASLSEGWNDIKAVTNRPRTGCLAGKKPVCYPVLTHGAAACIEGNHL